MCFFPKYFSFFGLLSKYFSFFGLSPKYLEVLGVCQIFQGFFVLLNYVEQINVIYVIKIENSVKIYDVCCHIEEALTTMVKDVALFRVSLQCRLHFLPSSEI